MATDDTIPMFWRRAVLPETLRQLLQDVSRQFSQGRITAATLRQVLTDLGAVPPQKCVRAANECTILAFPYPRAVRQSWISALFNKPYTDMLGHVAGIEYLFLFHRDGFQREAALKQISGPLPTPFWVAVIALRLNDWVGPVRRAAVTCAQRVFRETSPEVMIPAARFLLLQSTLWRRGLDEMAILDAALARADVRSGLIRDILDDLTGAGRQILLALLQKEGIDNWLHEISLSARNPGTRALALTTLIAGQARWLEGYEKQWIDKSMGFTRRVPRFAIRPIAIQLGFSELITQGAADKSTLVRKVALQATIDRPDTWRLFQKLVEQFSADKNPAIRLGADYILRHMAGES